MSTHTKIDSKDQKSPNGLPGVGEGPGKWLGEFDNLCSATIEPTFNTYETVATLESYDNARLYSHICNTYPG